MIRRLHFAFVYTCARIQLRNHWLALVAAQFAARPRKLGA